MDLRVAFQNAPVAGIIWLAMIIVSYYALSRNPYALQSLLLHPWKIVREGKYAMLVTHGFVHGNYFHLIINAYVYYTFAFFLEMVVGHVQFFIIYMGSLVVSGLMSTVRHKDSEHFRSLGASGAISGLVFSFVLYYPDQRLLLFFILPLPAWVAAILFVWGSYYAAKNNYLPGIDHEGHLWGALAGAILTIILNPKVIMIFFSRLFG